MEATRVTDADKGRVVLLTRDCSAHAQIGLRRYVPRHVLAGMAVRLVAREVRHAPGSELVRDLTSDDPRRLVRRNLNRIRTGVAVLRPRHFDTRAAMTLSDRGQHHDSLERATRTDRHERPRRIRLPRIKFAGHSPKR